MAISKSFFGLRRGRAGGFVYSVSRGKQVTRALAESVKNPKTAAQVLQRAVFKGVSTMRSLCSPIVDHSFQGRTPKQDSLSRFTSLNAGKDAQSELRALIADGDFADAWDWDLCPVASPDGTLFPGRFQISEGTLPPTRGILVNQLDTNHNFYVGLPCEYKGTSSSTSDQVPTYGDFLTQNGLQVGDYFTICLIKYDNMAGEFPDDNEGSAAYPYVSQYGNKTPAVFVWVRFTCLPASTMLKMTIANMSQMFKIETNDVDSEMSYGSFIYQNTNPKLRVVGIDAFPEYTSFGMWAIIHSRDIESGKLRSTEFMKRYIAARMGNTKEQSYLQAVLGGTLNYALNSWEIKDAFVLDGGKKSLSETGSLQDWYTNHPSTRPLPPKQETNTDEGE